ncbi:hypothetical protein KSC_018770 [Ktedonobacter sp. SOSP1-52]|nr:amidase family protein [Ktedonobacter sp. SOSP1-52]GHO62985.1 hypothetical protein KSC_018770 [Ktedonobacter sp. SOSP1-52]
MNQGQRVTRTILSILLEDRVVDLRQMNVPWSYMGMSVLSLPAGRAMNGLSLAVQVVALAMADEKLLAWAEPMAGVLVDTPGRKTFVQDGNV